MRRRKFFSKRSVAMLYCGAPYFIFMSAVLLHNAECPRSVIDDVSQARTDTTQTTRQVTTGDSWGRQCVYGGDICVGQVIGNKIRNGTITVRVSP